MTESQSARTSVRLEYLDGLRGIAALIVILSHFYSAFLPLVSSQYGDINQFIEETPLSILVNGKFSVFIFFVLSGFVLAESADRSKKTFSARLISRYLRLTVPMAFSIILAWILLVVFSHSRIELQSLMPDSWLTREFYGSDTPRLSEALKDSIYRVYTTGNSLFNDVVWTMRKELGGSIAIYVVYHFCPVRYRWVALSMLAISTLGSCLYLGFPVGASIRELWKRNLLKDSKWMWAAFGISLFMSLLPGMNIMSDRYILIYVIAAGFLILSILGLPLLRNIFSSPIPVFFGRISFSLYLIHVPLIISIIAWLYLHIAGPLIYKLLLVFAAFLSSSIIAAWLMTIWIDEPLVRALHHIRKLGSDKSKNR